jgi:hypothetical protein
MVRTLRCLTFSASNTVPPQVGQASASSPLRRRRQGGGLQRAALDGPGVGEEGGGGRPDGEGVARPAVGPALVQMCPALQELHLLQCTLVEG